MTSGKMISYFAIAAVAVVASVLGLTFYDSSSTSVETPITPTQQEQLEVKVLSSFGTTKPGELKDTAEIIIRGVILDSAQQFEYRNEEGDIVGQGQRTVPPANSQHVETLFTVYDVQINEFIKGSVSEQVIQVKTQGGEVDGFVVDAGFPKYSVDDEVIMILDIFDGDSMYHPLAKFNGIYVIEGNQAISKDRTMSVNGLLAKLT